MMASKKENISIKFLIKSVEVLKVFFNSIQTLPAELKEFHFNIKLESKLDQSNKLIVVITSVKINSNDIEKIQLGEIVVSCGYFVENFDEIIKMDNKKIIIDDEPVILLNSISISTTRGVMAQSFKGTLIHNAILPIVDPRAFVNRAH